MQVTKFENGKVKDLILNLAETQELIETGYCFSQENDYCFVMIDNEIMVFKYTDDYSGVKLTRN